MTPERWQRVRELFEQALDRPPEERTAFLQQSCGPDEAVMHEVHELLMAHAATGELIDQPAARILDAPQTPTAGTLAGRIIGPYTIIREIGRGGMGSVYLAQRSIGRVRQQVAFKIVHPGVACLADMTRRFEQEREILASLDHPNIARLIDAGSTENDVPYVVMEYVDGEPIDRYCDRNKLSIADRLNLFRTVCAVLEYAHEKGVVHRDLKPGNVLVTGAGTVKLVDFGIAKLLHESDDATAFLTRSGLRPMTVEYASPEQVKGEEITVSSDVYALGVVLYELLTGHRPYRMEGRLAHEVARIICEEPPLWPSAAVTEVETRTTSHGVITITPQQVSELRAERPSRLRRLLAGDLDSILMKALRKEPNWRYGSVQQMSEDIGRHLAGLPVSAKKDSWTYRTRKAVRRVLNPAGGVIHHNAPMFISWGIFGAVVDGRKQAILSGFRHRYDDWDMLPALIISLVLSFREGRRIRSKGYSSPLDRMSAIVLSVTVGVLYFVFVLAATTGVVSDAAATMFWSPGMSMALLIVGLQASRVLLAGGLILLLSIVAATFERGWYYGWLAAGILVAVSGAGVVFAFESIKRGTSRA